jgi:hypothetical protein
MRQGFRTSTAVPLSPPPNHQRHLSYARSGEHGSNEPIQAGFAAMSTPRVAAPLPTPRTSEAGSTAGVVSIKRSTSTRRSATAGEIAAYVAE